MIYFLLSIFLFNQNIAESKCNVTLWLHFNDFDNNDRYECGIYEKHIKGNKYRLHNKEQKILLEGEIFDCRGEMNFTLIDSTKKVILNGQYLNGLDTLKKQVYLLNPFLGCGSYIVKKYFVPIEHGSWVMKRFNGKVIKLVEYDGLSLNGTKKCN